MNSGDETGPRPDPAGDTDTVDLAGPALRSTLAGELPRGAAVGRYIVLDRIGRGGMGVVYAGYDPELDRKAALKLLRAEPGGGQPDDPSAGVVRLRLLREAQAIARLSHPNVIAVFDVGSFGDQVFLAMELVEGPTLRQWLAAQRRPWREVVARFVLAGRGLAAAHAAGLVHRDFKPDNVLLGADRGDGGDSRVRVADFGLARVAGGAEEPEPPTAADERGAGGALASPLTQWGMAVGTPGYMAPEQLQGAGADARSDQFSFCVALWEALYGERPFAGESTGEVAAAMVRGAVREAPAGSAVPDHVRQALLRGLAADPAARHPGMDALLERLERDPAAVRRRWLAAAAVAAVVAASFAGLGYLQARRGQLCSGAEEALAGVWNAPRKEAARAAFVRTGLPFAAAAWSRAEQNLDRYGGAWTAMHRGACEATRLRGEQSEDLLDRRMFCLDQRLREVDALAATFLTADGEVVRRADAATSGLAPLDLCADTEALMARLPPPADPAARARVEALGRELARVKALRAAGRYREGLALALEVDRRAGAAGHPPTAAEAGLLLGDLQEKLGEHEPAERTLRRAVRQAEAAAADEVRAAAVIALMHLLGDVQARFPEAHEWNGLAAAILDRLKDQGELRAEYLSRLGALYDEEGRFEDSLRAYEQAAEVRRRVFGDRSPQLAATLSDTGMANYRLGRYSEAMKVATRALEIQQAALGPQHPEVAGTLNRLGAICYAQNDFERALPYYRQALSIRLAAFGPRHRLVGDSYHNLGNIFDYMEKYDESLASFRQAHAIYVEAYGPSHPWVARALEGMGTAEMGRKNYGVAAGYFRQALEMKRATLGDDHVSIANTLYNLALGLDRQGRSAEAMTYFRQALARQEKALGPDHPEVAGTLTAAAQAEMLQKNLGEARRMLERALAIQVRGESAPFDLALTRLRLAQTLWDDPGAPGSPGGAGDGGNRQRAVALARQALDGFQSLGEEGEDLAAEAQGWLAERREAPSHG